MIKNFSYRLLKYSKPIWYFHLKPYNGNNYVWIQYDKLSSDQKKIIDYDFNYSNKKLSDWDASYQALMKGIIIKTNDNYCFNKVELLSEDIYRFTRKYYKKTWLYITLVLRLLLLNNPFDEIISFWKTKKSKRGCDLEKDKGCRITVPDQIGKEIIYNLERKSGM